MIEDSGTCRFQSKRVYATAKVNRLCGHHDAHVRSDRNHVALLNALPGSPRLASLGHRSARASSRSVRSQARTCIRALLRDAGSRCDAAGSGIDATSVGMLIARNLTSCPSLAATPSLPCSKRRFKPGRATPSTPVACQGGSSWHIRVASSRKSAEIRIPRTRDLCKPLKCLTASFRHTHLR